MNKFSDYIKSCDIKTDIKEENTQQLSDLIDKYSKYSSTELMDEFIKESAKKKQSGGLNDDDLQRMKITLAPYLNDEQKSKLNDLLNLVK